MKLLYGTNDKYYSVLHRKMINEPYTHVGILFFEDDMDIMLDCTKPYSKIYHIDHWKKKYKVIDEQEFILSSEKEKEYYDIVSKYCLGKPYDWGAYAYAWVLGIKSLFCGDVYIDKNPWRTDGLWCTEVVFPIRDNLLNDFNVDLLNLDLASKTPYMLNRIIDGQLERNRKMNGKAS